jgi:RHH-type rel operon transcriptional repressor/antitoxin RelB
VYNVHVAASTTLTVRLPKQDLARLELLARDTRRSRSYLAAEAISKYLDHQEWRIREIKKGFESGEREGWISDDVMDAWLLSWGTDHELPPEPGD